MYNVLYIIIILLMYINKPLVKISQKNKTSTPVKKKVVFTDPSQKVDLQQNNMNLITDLEKRIDLMLESLSKDISEYKNIQCNIEDEKKIKKAKESIQLKIKNQLKQQAQIQNFNQRQRAKVDMYIQQYTQSIKNEKKNLEMLKQNTLSAKNHLKILQNLKSEQEKLNADLEGLINGVEVKEEDYKVSEQKNFKTKQQLDNMDIHFFNLVNQNEQMLQIENKYFENLKILKNYQHMKKFKNKIIQEIDNMNQEYQNLADKKLEELVNVRNNTIKIQRILQEVQKQLYEQRYFLGLKQKNSRLDSIQVEEQQQRLYLEKQNQQDIKNKLRREYQQILLSPQPIKIQWQPYRQTLKTYLETRKQTVTNKLKKQMPDVRAGSSNHLQLKNLVENDYSEISEDNRLTPIIHNINHRNHTEPVYPEDSYAKKKNKVGYVSFKDTANTNFKIPRQQYNESRQKSTDKLKNRIREYLKNKEKKYKAKNSYPKIKNLRRNTKYKEDSQEIDLISVDSQQNDPNQEYIEVDASSQPNKKT